MLLPPKQKKHAGAAKLSTLRLLCFRPITCGRFSWNRYSALFRRSVTTFPVTTKEGGGDDKRRTIPEQENCKCQSNPKLSRRTCSPVDAVSFTLPQSFAYAPTNPNPNPIVCRQFQRDSNKQQWLLKGYNSAFEGCFLVSLLLKFKSSFLECLVQVVTAFFTSFSNFLIVVAGTHSAHIHACCQPHTRQDTSRHSKPQASRESINKYTEPKWNKLNCPITNPQSRRRSTSD